MLNLMNETMISGYSSEFLFVTSLVSIFFGVSMMMTKNPVVSVLFLMGLFFTMSVHLMMLGLYFMGLSYLLVYVGAVSMLFLFILMLMNVSVSELVTEGKNSMPLAMMAVLSFNLTINTMMPYSVHVFDAFSRYLTYMSSLWSNMPVFSGYNAQLSYTDMSKLTAEQITNMDVASVTSKSWDASLVENNHMTSMGNMLYTNLFMLLMMTSLMLLLAMVGTMVMTMKRKVVINAEQT